MAGEDRYDSLLLKAEGKQSDRHDEAFEIVWDDLEGFFESFGRGRRQAQARRRAMPAALEAMRQRRNAALAPAVRTMGGVDSPAPLLSNSPNPLLIQLNPISKKMWSQMAMIILKTQLKSIKQKLRDSTIKSTNPKWNLNGKCGPKKKKKKEEEPLVSDIPEATNTRWFSDVS